MGHHGGNEMSRQGVTLSCRIAASELLVLDLFLDVHGRAALQAARPCPEARRHAQHW